jgi:hypothetical protein
VEEGEQKWTVQLEEEKRSRERNRFQSTIERKEQKLFLDRTFSRTVTDSGFFPLDRF